jgi:vancomycin permeability regulator SanA
MNFTFRGPRAAGLEMPARRSRLRLETVARGLALFLGAFALLNIAGGWRTPHFDATLWWIDLRALPPGLARVLVCVAGLTLMLFAARPFDRRWFRWLTIAVAGSLAAVALLNAFQFYRLLARGSISSNLPLPTSLFIAAALGLIAASAWRTQAFTRQPAALARIAGVALACAVSFPICQMFCFGKTDYRRPADAAIVLGARAYADGRPSDALADRVRTACQLYRDGLVRTLIFSGGPGDGPVTECEAMRRMAVTLGVNPADIVMDDAGLNTEATVKNAEAYLAKTHASCVLVVSHFYHLPRVKLAFQRDGVDVCTVPARESYILRQTPYNMAREVAALWVYYLRPLAGPRA